MLAFGNLCEAISGVCDAWSASVLILKGRRVVEIDIKPDLTEHDVREIADAYADVEFIKVRDGRAVLSIDSDEYTKAVYYERSVMLGEHLGKSLRALVNITLFTMGVVASVKPTVVIARNSLPYVTVRVGRDLMDEEIAVFNEMGVTVTRNPITSTIAYPVYEFCMESA